MISRIRLKNFRRFEDETLTFKPGVNLITGRNNAGKTTLFYALEYVFFGAVANFKTLTAFLGGADRSMGVEVKFTTDEENTHYILQRMHEKPPRAKTKIVGHFTLKRVVTDGEETNEQYIVSSDFQDHDETLARELFRSLGISKRLFEHSIHTRQGQCSAILSGSSQLDMILGVTAAVVSGEEMRAVALEFEKDSAGVDYIDQVIEQAQEQIDDLSEQAEQLQEEASESLSVDKSQEEIAKISALEQIWVELRRTVDQLSGDQAKIQPLQTQLDEAKKTDPGKTIADSKKKITNLEEKLEPPEKQRNELTKQREAGLQTLGDLNGRLARAQKLEGKAECETCGQEIDQKAAAAQMSDWQNEIAVVEAEQSQIDGDLQKLENETETIQNEIAEQNQLISEMGELAKRSLALSKEISGIESQSENLINQKQEAIDRLPKNADTDSNESITEAIDQLRSQRIRLETELEHYQAQQDRFKREQQRITEKTKQLQLELTGHLEEKEELETKREVAETFRRSAAVYKELQTRIREKAALSLSERTLELHGILAGGSKEFKSIAIDSKNYAVNIVPQDLNTEVPAWLYQGGGHKALLGIAYKLALAELAGNCPFLLLDEPTDGLDSFHRESLFEALQSCPTAGQILVITHESPTKGDYHKIEIER